ncbi:nucleotidyl transferase AbiEii/AbiGii toxin family protein [Bosea sp. RAC05]|uniref:nucleotidyl transferase AbiEii/AbiGii toxin family protein n=1 Tax=Bosea sp. RAC05 TaxID=1842539 RepID=UPI00083DDA3D|nr:nucleotidyl transferase AbiEii/AbiGii toxin family protein [Bosea sp. RAC05]AOG03085.1 hypothetical protein BSY19_5310 [Bosea sp. RAC05]
MRKLPVDAPTALPAAERLARLARQMGLPADIVVREALQTRLISCLFRSSVSRQLALKGGMAMRSGYGSQRLTKDVDLQAGPSLPQAALRQAMAAAVDELRGTGLVDAIEFSMPKQTETVQRFKIGGRVAGGQSEIHLTVEISRRGLPSPELLRSMPLRTMDRMDGGGTMVEVYAPATMAASKVQALLAPNRTAARDLWDLNVLIMMRVETPAPLLAGLGAEGLDRALAELWPKLELLDYDLAKVQLTPYLPAAAVEQLTEEVWDEMRLRVQEHVEKWLREARDLAAGASP